MAQTATEVACPEGRRRRLAKSAGRNCSSGHADVALLVEPGRIERTDDDMVTVPFDAVEIRMALAQAA